MKTMVGKVVSTKMDKTVCVLVTRIKIHPRYKKRFKVSKKYLAKDELGVKKGQKVKLGETRPLSKKKRWEVLKVMDEAKKNLGRKKRK